jgi:hypothetical protein
VNVPGDPRELRQFVRVNDDGVVTSTHLVAVGTGDPEDGEGNLYVEVTNVPPQNFHALTFDRTFVADQKATLRAAKVTETVAPRGKKKKKARG